MLEGILHQPCLERPLKYDLAFLVGRASSRSAVLSWKEMEFPSRLLISLVTRWLALIDTCLFPREIASCYYPMRELPLDQGIPLIRGILNLY